MFLKRAKVYNELKRESNTERLKNLAVAFKRRSGTDGLSDSWVLNEQRLEEAFFLLETGFVLF